MNTMSTQHEDQEAPHAEDWTPVRFDAFRFLVRIVRRWRFIAGITLCTALLGLAYALTRKPYFEARASFLPPAHDASSSPMSAFNLFGPSLQAATYMGFLKSSTVQQDVAKRLRLDSVYKVRDVETAGAIVGGFSKFDATQEGIVTIKAQASTPRLAADIANAYLLAVHDLTQHMAEQSLSERAIFYAKQLKQSRQALEQSEASLQANQEKGGIFDSGSAAQVSVSAQARLQAAIQAAQVQLSSLLQSNTEASPAVIRARSEVAELRSQLAQQSGSTRRNGRGIEAGGALPGLAIEATRRTREVREREAVYEALLRQTEINHMGQEDPGPELQVIDMATPPQRKAGPGRMRYLVGGTLAGFLLAVFWAAAATWLARMAGKLRMAMQMTGTNH